MDAEIKELCRKNGCSLSGACRFDILPGLFNVRSRQRIPENAASVITFLFPYLTYIPEKRNLSLYCMGKDYHEIVMKRLKKAADALGKAFTENIFEPFCDSSPINEVYAAYRSGLGFLGKNGLIISPEYGSFCFIGEIVTDLELKSYDAPLGLCDGCGKCLTTCPFGALSENGSDTFSLDRSRCLSALTQQKKELTAEQEREIQRGGLAWGCDTCSLCCKMNKNVKLSDIKEFSDSLCPVLTEERLGECENYAYGYRGKQILKRNLSIIGEKSVNNKGK